MKIVENKLIMERGIRFISDSNYSLNSFQFPHILDKKIPGCGYTEYCITCDIPIILCSPRKILLENKEAQHVGEVFYFRNEFDREIDTGKDLLKVDRSAVLNPEVLPDENLAIEGINRMLDRLNDYLSFCTRNKMTPKILVTYDSFRIVKEELMRRDLFKYFHVVIDEFQSIFTDSRFKSTTEMEFVSQLQGIQKVCYVSATPMIDKYLKRLDEFKDLPYFEIDWETEDPSRVITPDLKVRVISSISVTANNIIKTYKEGKFDSAYVDGNLIYSNEAVFYVNSVTNIISIIKKAGLTPEECNILCANTEKNVKRIKTRLGKRFEIGRVPLKGEPHKMFTFCTRTVYLGADFYSNCARSFILSDANIDCLAVDITLDLPQILGRQRLLDNPWKTRAELYYKTLGKENEVSEEAFKRRVEMKLKKTENLLRSFKTAPSEAKHDLADNFRKVAKSYNYSDDYVAVNEHSGSDLVPCLNNLVLVAEERAFDIQQKDYKDRFTVFNTLYGNENINSGITCNILNTLNTFNSLEGFKDKMRCICECPITEEERLILLDQVPISFKNYYIVLGPEKCYSLGYNITSVSRAYSDALFDKNVLIEEIEKLFIVGERYTKTFIKETLGNLYKSLGYNKSPKATDIEIYFEVKHCMVVNKDTGKSDNGFIILKRKDDEK